MKKIIILGSSVAGAKAAEQIRTKDQESIITIIGHDGSYPYKRDIFPDVMLKRQTVEDIQYRPQDFYAKENIRIVTDRKISRINIARKKIYTEEKEQFDFDVLILTELPQGTKLTQLKGGAKEGIYALRKIKHIDTLIKDMPFFDTVVIQSDTFSGLQAAATFIQAGKEVYLLLTETNVLSRFVSSETKEAFIQKAATCNLNIIEDSAIDEILGDNEIKAVRFTSGKVCAAEVVILDENPEEFKLLSDAELTLQKDKIAVDEGYKTNKDGVYALDAFINREEIHFWGDFVPTEYLENQGVIVADAVMGEQKEIFPQLIERSIKLVGATITGRYNSEINQYECVIELPLEDADVLSEEYEEKSHEESVVSEPVPTSNEN